MTTPDHAARWEAFQSANRFRRAIRSFSATPVPPADLHEILAEATLAPSSGNLQPYQLHWVRDPSLKAAIAAACNGQKAAATAQELIVVVASPGLGQQTAEAQLAYVEDSATLGEPSKVYYRKQIAKFQKILGIGASPLWSPLKLLAALLRPALCLLPIGYIASRHWAARNAIYAAQTILIGAAAKGIDSCPMEGFSAGKLAQLLSLPRGSVIALVIALGYRAEDARLETQWRRPVKDIVVIHEGNRVGRTD
jgi:nitroreductase